MPINNAVEWKAFFAANILALIRHLKKSY